LSQAWVMEPKKKSSRCTKRTFNSWFKSKRVL
jgi:hypothetical protein